jgi:hypothetical protein
MPMAANTNTHTTPTRRSALDFSAAAIDAGTSHRCGRKGAQLN